MAMADDEGTTVEASLRGKPTNIKNFYIFGQGISFSLSPTIHLAGFQHYGLPHTYEIYQTKTVDELSHIILSPTFGGSSVTMPHKLAIGRFCSTITEHAHAIGAVNTLIPEKGNPGRIRGDNTDWSGLLAILCEKYKGLPKSPETGLVIGAGGASRAALYAMYKSGLKTICLFNRTKSRAEQIAQELAPLFQITILDSLDVLSKGEITIPDILIGTIPAERTTMDFFPKVLFDKPHGICIDMSYKQRFTPLLEAATQKPGWSIVTGIDVLMEQAFDQFRLWTGEEPPKGIMKAAVAARERKDAEKRH